jgi:hypothetical protein
LEGQEQVFKVLELHVLVVNFFFWSLSAHPGSGVRLISYLTVSASDELAHGLHKNPGMDRPDRTHLLPDCVVDDPSSTSGGSQLVF